MDEMRRNAIGTQIRGIVDSGLDAALKKRDLPACSQLQAMGHVCVFYWTGFGFAF